MNKMDVYLEQIYTQDEVLNLLEGITDALPKIDVNLAKKLTPAIDEKRPVESAKRITKLAPTIPLSVLDKVDSYASSKIAEYAKLRDTATRIVQNSLTGVSPKMAKYAGSYLAIASMVVKKSDKNISIEKNLKNNIKQLIEKARQFGEDYEDEDEDSKKPKMRAADISDMVVAFAVIVMSGALLLGLLKTMLVLHVVMAAAFQPVTIIFMVLFFLIGLAKIAASVKMGA